MHTQHPEANTLPSLFTLAPAEPTRLASPGSRQVAVLGQRQRVLRLVVVDLLLHEEVPRQDMIIYMQILKNPSLRLSLPKNHLRT